MNTIVIYHGGGCPDGLMAAAVCVSSVDGKVQELVSPDYELFRDSKGQSIYTIPASYGESLDNILLKFGVRNSGVREILKIVDFSFSPEDLILASKIFHKVIILDHHKTAQDKLLPLIGKIDNLEIIFDMHKCGAQLAWDYHYQDKEIPEIVGYIGDRDLWEWKLRGSREVSAALSLRDKTVDEWVGILNNEYPNAFARDGAIVLKYQKQLIDAAVRRVREVVISSGFREDSQHAELFSVNSPVLQSEIGEAILAANPGIDVACIYYHDLEKQTFNYSVRSRQLDTGKRTAIDIAKMFNGGGHPAAAGFSLLNPPRVI